MAAGDAQPIQDVMQRATVVGLLTKALRQSNLRTLPYDLRTSMNAQGSTPSDGSWKLRDTSNGAGVYRWTAEGPSYSIVNLFVDQLLYSNQESLVPLRLAQVRSAIFFKGIALGPRAGLRSVNANLDGMDLSCVLVSHLGVVKAVSGPRRWEESEYCVEPKSGNLISYSEVPGKYVQFDYAKAIRFHDKIFPDSLVLTEGGQTVIEAHFDSLTDPPADPALYQPAGLTARGVGALMTQAWRIPVDVVPQEQQTGVVVVDAMKPSNGPLNSVEVITSTNPSLNEAAKSYVVASHGEFARDDAEPGSTPAASEMLFVVHFTPAMDAPAR